MGDILKQLTHVKNLETLKLPICFNDKPNLGKDY